MDFNELQGIVSVCLDEIERLRDENNQLKENMNLMAQAIKNSTANNIVLSDRIDALTKDTNSCIAALKSYVGNGRYEWNAPNADSSSVYYPKFYSFNETIDEIVNGGKSLARYGDGEFDLMNGRQRYAFQKMDIKLAERLMEVIQSEDDKCLIAIPDNYGDLSLYNEQGRDAIRIYMTEDVRKFHRQFLDLKRTYHNTYISRPYVMWADNNTDAPKQRFENLKRIWQDRDVIFVEGSKTRLGVGNDLFNNARSIRRIEAPATSSFSRYNEILSASLKYAKPQTLFMIALGPTAGVLAYDLCKAGYQALDIGHLDMEYEWFLQGKGCRVAVPTKYNNEMDGGNQVENVADPVFLSQILCSYE